MAEDVANLSLKVQTDSVENASQKLGIFADKAEEAAAEAKRFEQSADAMAKRINEVKQAASGTADGIGRVGNEINKQNNYYKNLTISQGQYTNAVRMMPAQLSDIATQLQMGTNPFTILVQQGGQIKDQFGGVNNTLKAFVGVLSPAIIAATALGVAMAAIGYAAYQVSDRYDDVKKVIIETGGAAFSSSAQLEDAAKRIGAATGETVQSVTQLLVKMQESGKYSAASIESSAKAITQWKKAFGDTDDLEKGLQKLTTDPVKGLEQLNEKFHFVTPAIMEQVVAMQKAGDAAGATALALETVGNVAETRSKQMAANASEISKAWSSLKQTVADVADGFGKALIGIGDQVLAGFELLYQSIKGVLLDVDKLSRQAVNGVIDQIRKLPTMSNAFADAYQQNMDLMGENDKAQIANKKELIRLQTLLNRSATEQYDATRPNVTASGATTAAQDAATKKLADEINKKNKAAKQFQEDAGDKLLDQLNMQTLQLQEQKYLYENHLVTGKQLTQEQQKYLALKAQIAVLEQRSAAGQQLTTEQKQVLAVKDRALAIAKANALESEGLDILKKQNEAHKNITEAIQESQERREAILRTAGMSNKEAERELQIVEGVNKLKRQGAAQVDIDSWVKEQKTAFKQADDVQNDYFAGLSRGWKSAAEDAGNVYSQMEQFGANTFNSLSESLAGFFETGKLGWKSFASEAISQLLRIVTNSALSDLVKTMSGMFGGGGGAGIMSSIGSYFGFAKGGVFSEPSLSAYSNMVVDKPTPFTFTGRSMFAQGGVFGEAGPEAVMPLTRGADGKLGVKASGGGGSGNFDISTMVNVTGGQQQGGGASNAIANELGNQINQQIEQVIMRMLQPGGLLFRLTRNSQ